MFIETIGQHKIIAPKEPQLTFSEGLALAEKSIKPLIPAFLKNQINIVFLVPEERSIYTEGVSGSTITADFFIGLFEELFLAVRDAKFPDIKIAAARDSMSVVSGTDFIPPEADSVLSDMFQTAWQTYDLVEQELSSRIGVGLLLGDGSYVVAEFNDERMMAEIANKDVEDKLFRWSNKYYKAMDAMFMSNLTMRSKIMDGLKASASMYCEK